MSVEQQNKENIEMTKEQKISQLSAQVGRYGFLTRTHLGHIMALADVVTDQRPFTSGADPTFYRVEMMLKAREEFDRALLELARLSGQDEIVQIYQKGAVKSSQNPQEIGDK